jgi:hypothetical protein
MSNVSIKSLFAVLALTATFGAANAETIRDHRGPQVRDHRFDCVFGQPNCPDHVVVVPPRPRPFPLPPVVVVDPQPPIVVVDPLPRPPRPQPPVIPIDPGDGSGNWGGDQNGYDYISCREGRQIVRENGFRHVRAFDCDGRVYGFRADNRHGGAKIRMTNRGDIISVQYYTY